MNVLLIFNNVDIVQLFKFENLDSTTLAILRECHGCYLGMANIERDCTDRAIKFLENLSDPIFDESGNFENVKISGDYEIIVCGAF